MNGRDRKQWVTIKIPEGVRDDARDDPRTYGEIMRDGLETTETPDEPESVDTEALGREVARQIDYAHLSDRVSEQVTRELGR